MSHVGNGEHDFDRLKVSEILDEETVERIKQARIEARSIIDRLEPFHISSWADLLTKLKDSLDVAKINAMIIDPAFREMWERQQIEIGLKEQRRKKIDSSFRITVMVIGLLLFALILVNYFVGPLPKRGEFIWAEFIVLPTAIIGFGWGIYLFLEIRRLFKGRKEIPVSELTELFGGTEEDN